jgi:hypothetical protein
MACGVDLGRHIEPLTRTRQRHSGVSRRTMAVARARKAETLEYNYKIWSDLPSKVLVLCGAGHCGRRGCKYEVFLGVSS